MTTTEKALETTKTTVPATMQMQKEPKILREMLATVNIKRRFEDILGTKAAAFISSILSAAQSNAMLSKADPHSVIAAAAVAASLDLPINGSLGFAALVPYKQKDGTIQAQFQIMSRGFVQLAQRTGQYKSMSVSEVYEGELISGNGITGEYLFDRGARTADTVIGYVFYFQLVNGFENYTYMTVEEVKAHAKKYSKSYDSEYGMWRTNFPMMALKTVVKRGLSKWGPLSTDMQRAVETDQAVIRNDGSADYIDAKAVPETEIASPAVMQPRRASQSAKPEEDIDISDLTCFVQTKPPTMSKDGLIHIWLDDKECFYTDNNDFGTIAKTAHQKQQPLEVAWIMTEVGKKASNVTAA